MSSYTAFKRGKYHFRPGVRYELVYSGTMIDADPETVRHVVASRPGVAVPEPVRVDPFDLEIHVVVVTRGGPVEQVVQVDLVAVPNDSWTRPGSAIANLAGLEGTATLDRFRELGPASRSLPELEERDEAADSQLDASNVRNAAAKTTRDLKRIFGGVGGIALGLLGLIGLVAVIDR